jgi:tetratricopeptide (TPR) repeat protein
MAGFKIVSQTSTEVVDRDPNLYVKRAEMSLKEGQYQEALQEMDQAITYASPKQKNKYIFEKIKVYGAVGKDSSCLSFIDKHITVLYQQLTVIDFYRVIAVIKKNAKSNDFVTFLTEHNIPSVLADVYSSKVTTRSFFYKQAEDYQQKKQYRFALECVSVLSNYYGDDADTWLLRGRILRDQGDYKEAFATFSRGLSKMEAYIEISNLHLQLNQKQEAVSWIDRGLKAFSSNEKLLHFKADFLFKDGDYEACFDIVDTILANNSSDARAMHLMGMVYDHQKKYLRSNHYLKKAVKLDGTLEIPENPKRERAITRMKFLGISIPLLIVLVYFIVKLLLFIIGTVVKGVISIFTSGIIYFIILGALAYKYRSPISQFFYSFKNKELPARRKIQEVAVTREERYRVRKK